MRIATWNCCRGKFETKTPLLDPFEADVIVLQEVARPVASNDALWFGTNPRQGLAVVARNGYTAHALPVRRGIQRHIVPIQITGPRSFFLLAVWSLNEKPHPYVRAVIHAARRYQDLIRARPSVIVGDFNSNVRWDRKRKGSHDHSFLVNLLTKFGLVSAYHHFHGETQGAETRPTYYSLWKELAPYHLDHCFLPAAWSDALSSVTVGNYADWAKFSDHRPMVVEIA
ncbi:MAG: endonuclease/exonuclease/phosphatase family protein [Vicinamibacteria bacterium]